MLKISRRTRLSNASGVYFVRHMHRAEAERLFARGAITADETRGNLILSFRMVESYRAPLDIRLGSFGIHREHVPVNQQYGLSGGIVFSHRDTGERLAA